MNNSLIKVSIGIFRDGDKILIAQSKKKGNKIVWEFPGGKNENKETSEQTLYRELKEELNVVVRKARLIKRFATNIDGSSYELSIFSVVEWEGKCISLEGQVLKWVPISELLNYNMHEPNKKILPSLMLPNKIMITPFLDKDYKVFLENLELLERHEIELLQLRLTHDKSTNKLISKEVKKRSGNKVRIMINGSTSEFDENYFDGIHLPFNLAKKLNVRPVKKKFLFSISCHNIKEIEHADHIDADFVYLSPINQTTSHPNSNFLGWSKASKIAAASSKPVYALGGLSIVDTLRAIENGFQGIAGITTFWNFTSRSD